MSIKEIFDKISDPQLLKKNSFQILSAISKQVGLHGADREVTELILRVAERRAILGESEQILDCLLRRIGLFPYAEPNNLSTADQLAYECHRVDGDIGEGLVFHRAQANLFHRILNGENIVLSAPTSFGKSLIIDAVISTEIFTNLVVIVPTIALIDETRRRLSQAKHSYKLITHNSQARSERNIFLLTPERVLDIELPPIQFFVVDEFYKLALTDENDSERSAVLNQAFQKLWRTGAQFYLLGPNIQNISEGFEHTYNCKFISTDFSTVVSEVHRVNLNNKTPEDALVELCRSLSEPTIIYCSSPGRVSEVVRHLLDNGLGTQIPALTDAVNWIAREFHSDWILGKALGSGIGIHHGRLPRSLAQYIVRKFNEGTIKFLVCTSTLIEGVNTKAKNVVIYDNKIARRNLDYFTFNNIRGRSGRMFQHFIGRTFLFHDAPQGKLRSVEIPLITQDAKTPNSLLIQLESNELSASSKNRIAPFYTQQTLSVETLRANSGIDPEMQLAVAQLIQINHREWHSILNWRGRPKYSQLEGTCKIIWENLIHAPTRIGGAHTFKQLAYKIYALRTRVALGSLIRKDIEERQTEVDEAVGNALDFVRQWAGFHFPRLLGALDRIQREVFTKLGYQSFGDYSPFAEEVEGLFLPSSMVMLEEYGLPIQLARKLESHVNFKSGLDDALLSLKELTPMSVSLSQFEKELVADIKRFL